MSLEKQLKDKELSGLYYRYKMKKNEGNLFKDSFNSKKEEISRGLILAIKELQGNSSYNEIATTLEKKEVDDLLTKTTSELS